MVAAAKTLRVKTEDLMSALRVRMPELLPASGDDSDRDAIQHIEVARQLLTFFAALNRDPAWAEPLGARYALIGTAIGVSPSNGVGQPEEGSIEAHLTAAPGNARFIPTHRGRGLPARELSTRTVRSKSSTNPSYDPLTQVKVTTFDWLGVIDEVILSRGSPEHGEGSNERTG